MNILELFQYNQKLKFSDIEKALKVRSNKLSYHLKNLTKKGLLVKEDNYYSLSNASEYIIPYLSEKNSSLPVLLIYIGNKNNAYLYKRNKRPFKDMLSLPGGRILLGESLNQAAERLMKKDNIKAKLKQVHSISLEHVKSKNNIVHSFLLIFVSAETKTPIKLTNLKKNKSKIITSDYKLIKEDLNKKINIKTIITRRF
jgi:ADP-ribose pyrophosphatase YjhB (NUDIX family)